MSNVGAIVIASPLIQYYESCKLRPYRDSDNLPTIGWGNRFCANGDAVTMATPELTQAEANSLFTYWLTLFANKVEPLTPQANRYQLAAFISLAYNIGFNAFDNSTALRDFTASNLLGAEAGIEMWNRSGGQVLKGLQRRRRAERLVFQGNTISVATNQALKDFP